MVPENTRKYAKSLQHETILRQNKLGYPTREVPVDVHANSEQNPHRTMPSSYHNSHAPPTHQSYNHTSHIRVPSTGLPYLDHQPQQWVHDAGSMQPERCWRCGLLGPCACVRASDNMGLQSSVYMGRPGQDSHMVKNAVRLARNRKVNASFRAAMDGTPQDDVEEQPVASDNQEQYASNPCDAYQPIIIEVDCEGSTVLGITVEASQSLGSQRKSKSNPHGIELSAPLSLSYNNERIPRGLQITNIQDNSVIHRNGNFRIGDIIVEVNGVNLDRRPFQDAQNILKTFVHNNSSQNVLLLRILRKTSNSMSSKPVHDLPSVATKNDHQNIKLSPKTTPTKNVTSPSSSGARHLAESLNTRRIGHKHRIQLRKSNNGGFGIKIAERDNARGTNRPIYIIAITTTGAAYRDGRLKEGDMLLEINGIDVTDKTQAEVTKMLKGVGVDEPVEFVVSRQELSHDECSADIEPPIEETNSVNDCDNERSLIDFESPNRCDRALVEQNSRGNENKVQSRDGPGIYVYDIPINDTKSAGLGLYLKYPSLNRKDLGIWIEKVITGGAAWKDGRLQPDDQILAINGINLMGLSNTEAAETLTAAVCKGIGPEVTSNTIRLNIHRRDPSIVTKILRGTNNRIAHSDLPSKEYNRSCINIDSTMDSYKTAFESTPHSRSQSSTETTSSNRSGNQNSHSDLALSPQTQASDSLRYTNSYNDKSSSSEQTNSSAISQATDFTNLPIDNNRVTAHQEDNTERTMPKSLDQVADNRELDRPHSERSWDEESLDVGTGEDRFQRDGFGRQSISEKRHAQLNAKNTDTYRRNQKLREERERQRLEKLKLDQTLPELARPKSLNVDTHLRHQSTGNRPGNSNGNNHLTHQIDQLRDDYNLSLRNTTLSYPTREVPVDVHANSEQNPHRTMPSSYHNSHAPPTHQSYNHTSHIRVPSTGLPYLDHQPQQWVHDAGSMQPERCWRCGLLGPCACVRASDNMGLQSSVYMGRPGQDSHMVKNAVRLARNRKVNASFRAAIDRSYEDSIQPTIDDRMPQYECTQVPYVMKTNHPHVNQIGINNLGVRDESLYALQQQHQQRASDHRNLYYWGP